MPLSWDYLITILNTSSDNILNASCPNEDLVSVNWAKDNSKLKLIKSLTLQSAFSKV